MQSLASKIARLFALLGGITLGGLVLLVVTSISGRILNGLLHSDGLQGRAPDLAAWLLARGIGPINGDYEIVEAGMAFAIFAFLPICQLSRGHASVDVFADRLPGWLRPPLQALTDLVFAAVLVLLAWQLTLGGLSKYRSGQTTLLLEFPVWWSYAASAIALWVAALIGCYLALAQWAGPGPAEDVREGPPIE